MEGLQFSIPQRLAFIRVTLVISVIASMLISFRLWAGDRFFPYIEVFDTRLHPVICSNILSATVVLCLVASLFLRLQRLLLFVALICIVGLVLFDLNRMQWWMYLYAAMLVIFVVYNGRVDDPNRYTSYFIILQVMLASVYFYCGLHQLNADFVNEEYRNTISPLRSLMSERQFSFFVNLGVFFPFTLLFMSVCLLIPALRYLAITLGAIMHFGLMLLILLAPQTIDWVLWTSNITFFVLLLLLFSGKTKQRYFSPAFLLQKPLFYLVFAFFVVMPAFSLVGRWPDALSFNFKSGNYTRAQMRLHEDALQGLPLYIMAFCDRKDEEIHLDYLEWSLHELRVPCLAHRRTFDAIALRINALSSTPRSYVRTALKPKKPMLFMR